MSFKVSHPADSRAGRIGSEEDQSSLSVSNFHFCYKVKPPAIDSDEEKDEKVEECYSVNFEAREKGPNYRKFSGSRYGTVKHNLYDMLTDKSKAALEALEQNLLERIDRGEELPEASVVCSDLRIITCEPQMEFDDFDNLKNYSMGVTRYGLGNNVVASKKFPVMVYNNLTNLTILSVDLSTKNFAVRSLYQPRHEDILTYLGLGFGKYEGCAITIPAKERALVFIEIASESVLFKIPLEDLAEDKLVSAVATLSHNHIVIVFEDWTVHVMEIESAKLVNSFKIPDDISQTFDFIQNVFVNGEEVLLGLSNGLVSLEPFSQVVKTIYIEDLESVDLFWAKNDPTWMVAASLGSDKVIGVNLNDSTTEQKTFEGQRIIAIDTINSTQEICLLLEQIEKPEDSKEEIKKVVLMKLGEGKFNEVDQLNVFSRATSLTALGNSSYLVLEGNQYFNLLATNDTKLAADIVNGLYESNKSEADEPVLAGGEQPSTKGHTDGTPPAQDETSTPGSVGNTPLNLDHEIGLQKLVDQRINSGPTKFYDTITDPLMDQEKLVNLIDERLMLYKEQLKKELIFEIKEQLLQELKEQPKKELEFRRSRPTSKNKDGRDLGYSIKISEIPK